MKSKELEIIAELMEQLSGEMEYGEDDFMERLGRKKPKVEVIEVEGKMPMDEDSMDEEAEMDLADDEAMVMGEEEISPEEQFKQRLMKIRK